MYIGERTHNKRPNAADALIERTQRAAGGGGHVIVTARVWPAAGEEQHSRPRDYCRGETVSKR
jgi:hypothetical protein